MSVGDLLAKTLSPDQHIREDATRQLEGAAKENFPAYLAMLSQELANENSQSHIRNAAGLALKNSLTARDFDRKIQLAQGWTSMDMSIREQIKGLTLQTLQSKDSRAGSTAAQVTAAIAAIELPRQEWQNLIALLLQNVQNASEPDSKSVKQASLQAIGFICESIDPEILETQANQILTAVVQGARKDEPSNEVRLAAIHALYNSLEFIRDNFAKEGERNYIMQVVCEATQSTDVQVQVAAFECLVRIMQLYYDYMELYMQKALFGLTILGMKHEDEKVALQAVEFWSTVCDEEMEIILEAQEARYTGQPCRPSYNFASTAVNELVPVLLWLLTKKEDDEDEDEWNVSMAAATCLSLLAQCVQDSIVSPIIPFVESNIRNADWKYREAAVMAFGSILEGPSPTLLEQLVAQALPVIIDMMGDPVVSVKDTTAWTLGRISSVLSSCIRPDQHLESLIGAVLNGLSDSPRVASNCAWCIMNLAEQLGVEDDDTPSNPLSRYFENIIQNLMLASERGQDPNLSASAYEAISTLVNNAAMDCLPSITQLATSILDRLDQTIAAYPQAVGMDDRNAIQELQANLCSVLTSVIRRLQSKVVPLADRIMTTVLSIITNASKSSTVLEDAFLAVGAITTALEGGFVRYMSSFMQYLLLALSNHEEYQMCSIAVGLVGDICRALNLEILPYCDPIMNTLVANLPSPVLHRNVKPAILSSFGDIALAISDKFVSYMDVVMNLLHQAARAKLPMDSEDMIEYANQLREGIVEAYVGITQGLKTGNQVQALTPWVESIFAFLEAVYNDPDRSDSLTRHIIGLLGDLAEAIPDGRYKSLFQRPWVDQIFKDAKKKMSDATTKGVAKWAKEMIRRHMEATPSQ